ncbi:MAG: deoxyguanosinetriphosphate triphosphohydrolase, partial [Pseudomonadota bacterium]
LDSRRTIHETIRRMFGVAVNDLIGESQRRLGDAAPANIDAVRAAPGPLIGFSEALKRDHIAMKQYLRDKLYRHPRVRDMTERAKSIINQLFAAYMQDASRLPEDFQARIGVPDSLPRVVADYIAGMTDRFAQLEHERLGRVAGAA